MSDQTHSSTSTITLSSDTMRFYQGTAAGREVIQEHAATTFPDFRTRLSLYWFYVGVMAIDRYKISEPSELSTYILGANTVAPTETFKIYVMSFCPTNEHKAAVGGFEWRLTLADAQGEYDKQVAHSKHYDGSNIVRLLEVEVDTDPLYVTNTDAVTAELDSRIDELEDSLHALAQFVPADSEYPPSGGADRITD